MSIASRISQIEQHLTDDYSVLELAGADLTNVDKNIQNLKEQWQKRLLYFLNNGTDVIWNNWNKVTGTGTSIKLDNTLEANMKIDLEGNTYQEKTTGKNLINSQNLTTQTINDVTFTPVYKDGLLQYINVNGTASDRADYKFTYTNNLEANTYINQCIKNVTDDKVNTLLVKGGSAYARTTDELTRTLEAGIYEYWVRLNSGDSASNIKVYPQLILSSVVDKTYEPYTGGLPSPNPLYPQEVQVVTGDNTIVVRNANLFDKNATTEGAWLLEDGTLSLNHNNYWTSDYILVQPNTAYYKRYSGSVRSKYYDKNKVPLNTTTYQDIPVGGSAGTFTTPSNCYYIKVTFSPGNNMTLDNFMINLGTTDMTYVSAQSQEYEIDLGNIELCKIGTYKDYLYKSGDKWYKHTEIGKVVLDGTDETTIESGSGTNTYRFRTANDTLMGATNGYCNNNQFVTSGVSSDTQLVGITGGYIYYRINKSIIDAVAGSTNREKFNNWLSSNNTDLYVPLITPTEEEITNTDLISQLNSLLGAMSYLDQTNVSQENSNLASMLNATALEEIS